MSKEAKQQQEIPVDVQKEYFEKQLEDLKSKEEQLYFQLDQVQSAKLVFANRLDQIAKDESPIIKPEE
jgi:predicted acetyltransferase